MSECEQSGMTLNAPKLDVLCYRSLDVVNFHNTLAAISSDERDSCIVGNCLLSFRSFYLKRNVSDIRVCFFYGPYLKSYSLRRKHSEQSARLLRSKGRTVLCHTGFVCEPTILLSGMPSAATGAALSWVFRFDFSPIKYIGE